MDNQLLNTFGNDRLGVRQMDELIGIARGLAADNQLNLAEAEYLQSWLATNLHIVDQPLISTLYRRVSEYLSDGVLDADEASELLDTLHSFTGEKIELGEALKATSLPLCNPAPTVHFTGQRFCFTGTFTFGRRQACEAAVNERGASAGTLTAQTDFLVIGAYATESWRHSNFGTKIIKAVSYQQKGRPISIICEEHWRQYL